MSLLCQEEKLLFYMHIFEIVGYRFSSSCNIMHYQMEVGYGKKALLTANEVDDFMIFKQHLYKLAFQVPCLCVIPCCFVLQYFLGFTAPFGIPESSVCTAMTSL